MTTEELFCDLFEQYCEAFNWRMIPFTQAGGSLVAELKREIGEGHFLYHKTVWAVAKCEANDDVLYVGGDESDNETYYIFHLTYSNQNAPGFPRYQRFADIYAVKEFFEQSFAE